MHPVIQQLTATRGAGAAAWTPAQLSNQVGWWRASDITGKSDGDSVTAWPDSYGLLSEATGTGTYRTGANGIGGQPVVEFDGTVPDYFSTGYTGTPTDFFAWAVFNLGSADNFEIVLEKGQSSGFRMNRRSSNEQVRVNILGTNTDTNISTSNVYCFFGKSGTSGFVEVNTVISTPTVSGAALDATDLTLGNPSTFFLSGKIEQAGILSGYPSSEDIANLRAYITSETGITTS